MVATRSSFHSQTPSPSTSKTAVEMTTTLSRTKGSVIPTPDGVLTVRPYRSSSTSQLKAVLSFTPRVSSLDRQNPKSQSDEFRGFFVLFWIGMSLLFARTSLESWETNRTPLSWNFGRLITRDAFVLALSDGIMMVSMFFCVLFVKALQTQWFSYQWVGMVIQHAFQLGYLAMACWWGYHRQWYWVQSGFLVLHALSNLMKMHSYMAHNGMLSTVYFRLREEKAELAELVDSLPGGAEEILREATVRHAHLDAKQANAHEESTPLGTPGSATPPSGTMSPSGTKDPMDTEEAFRRHLTAMTDAKTSSRATSSDILPDGAEIRRRTKGEPIDRKSSLAMDALPHPQADLPHGTSLEPSHITSPHDSRAPDALAWSPNDQVALLARNIDAMENELKSNGAKGLVWPQNVTYLHFIDYIFIPTLVYELEYPRTSTMRPLVVMEKIIATFGTFSLIYLITEHYIMPYTPKAGDSMLRTYVNLALPMMINYLLIFYIIFECVCTGFAEISHFADREFYQDWWNSTSWDQFSRKWNKPVHTFLLRHVYASTMDGLHISRPLATFLTFLLSALCHELVMAVVTKKIRPYLFIMQMAQLPMIALTKTPIIRRNKTVGNIVFWFGLMSGFPMLAICYLVY